MAGQPQILAMSGAAITAPGDTNENTLVTINVPAGAMGANGMLRTVLTWSQTNSANTKTMRIRFSGASGTQFLTFPLTATAEAQIINMIQNRNATNSQVGHSVAANGFGGGTAVVTASVDTTAATTLVITGQKDTAGETLTLERYIVELLPSQ